MIVHLKDGRKVKGRFLQKNQNSVCLETEHEGPRAIGVEQIRSVERAKRIDRAGTNERGQPVHPKDAGMLRWPHGGY